MPSIMIHLSVAQRLLDDLGVKDEGSYFLGAIAPDAVNLGAKADKSVRYGAHLRSADYDEWIKNIAAYCAGIDISGLSADFHKGFIVHLLTDIAWDLEVQLKIFDRLSLLGVPDEELNIKKWSVLQGFDISLLEEDIWKNVIQPSLRCAETDALCTVDREQLLRWRDYIASESFRKAPEEDFGEIITREDIKLTADKVLELISSSGIKI